jgi:hypothetical protein
MEGLPMLGPDLVGTRRLWSRLVLSSTAALIVGTALLIIERDDSASDVAREQVAVSETETPDPGQARIDFVAPDGTTYGGLAMPLTHESSRDETLANSPDYIGVSDSRGARAGYISKEWLLSKPSASTPVVDPEGTVVGEWHQGVGFVGLDDGDH